jgi:hypothetical protein
LKFVFHRAAWKQALHQQLVLELTQSQRRYPKPICPDVRCDCL